MAGFKKEVKICETEEEETDDRETNSWKMENEGTETTEKEVSGRSTAELSTTNTMISHDEDNEKSRE